MRIEDTDQNRFVEGSDKRIVESLNWLGIVPDNIGKIVYQSKRLDIYKAYVLKLLEEGKAYVCTCSKERLEALRKEQEEKKLPTGYDGKCRDSKLKITDVKMLEEQLSEGAVVRMKMPKSGKIVIEDLIRGRVEFDAALTDDQVIMKSDGFPTYHLAHVIDDHEAGISHVIRAEEWLPSTPKHIVLNEMLGFSAPKYAHLSMILGPDKKKLSKRHGATSVIEYKSLGYLPEALVNFIAFLGWNPKDEREIFSMNELINEFKLENVNKAPAVFNIEKLDFINSHYIAEIINSKPHTLRHLFDDFELKDVSEGELQLLGRGGFNTLKEAAEYLLSLRKSPEYDSKILVFKKSTKAASLKGIGAALTDLENIPLDEWNTQEVQMKLGLVVVHNDLGNGDVFWPVRVALSGQEKSPSPVELAIALGKDETIKRIKKAISKLQ